MIFQAGDDEHEGAASNDAAAAEAAAYDAFVKGDLGGEIGSAEVLIVEIGSVEIGFVEIGSDD